MTTRLICLILFVFALTPAFAASGQDQKPATNPAVQGPAAEPLGEDEPIPFMRSEQMAASAEPSSTGLLLKTFASMIFIIGLIFVGAWGAKKLGYGNGKNPGTDDGTQLSVVTSVSLGNGRTVSAIKFGSRILLVGSTPQSFTLLAEEDGDLPVNQVSPRSVAELLAENKSDFTTELKTAESRLNPFLPGAKIS